MSNKNEQEEPKIDMTIVLIIFFVIISSIIMTGIKNHEDKFNEEEIEQILDSITNYQ